MFKKTDRERMDTLYSYVTAINSHTIDVKTLLNDRKAVNTLYWRAADAERENAVLKTKVELYEKFIAKMLESDSNKSNDVFMLDGEIYRLRDYHIDVEAGEAKTLTAEFVCMTGKTKNFKENDT